MALTKLPAATDDDQAEREYMSSCLIMLSRGLRDDNVADATRATGDAPTSANMADGYKCSVCGKVFASYQALGGHKTRHRKPPAAAAPSDEASTSGTAHEKLHQCSLCPRTFSSGQALGGHMTRHRKPPPPVVVLDFDLNMPAEAAPPDVKRACTDDDAAGD
ncbi:Zinc finger protein ZAT4 [Zea mays]|uniref:Zinc finger protein ZAT4 n=1 Tax=Zea mays TaxID=4577 RepID=A0A3L6FZF1_MAIZE|nr:Zinc finger protein ZAT4 [Zea mays]